MKIIEADKTYTIKFAKSGILQYARFSEKDDKIIHAHFNPTWVKTSEIPSLKGLDTIEEILKVIKEFSYCNRAEIYLIDGVPINFYKNKKARKVLKSFKTKLEDFIEKEAIAFFESVLEPIIKKNKWFIARSWMGVPVITIKDKKGEWVNIPRDKKRDDFEYLCYKFCSNLQDIKASFEGEQVNHVEGFSYFFGYIPDDYFTEKGLYVELN